MCVTESSSELDDTGESDIEDVATSALFTVMDSRTALSVPAALQT